MGLNLDWIWGADSMRRAVSKEIFLGILEKGQICQEGGCDFQQVLGKGSKCGSPWRGSRVSRGIPISSLIASDDEKLFFMSNW